MITLLPNVPPLPSKAVYDQAVAYITAGNPINLAPYPLLAAAIVVPATAAETAANIIATCGTIWA